MKITSFYVPEHLLITQHGGLTVLCTDSTRQVKQKYPLENKAWTSKRILYQSFLNYLLCLQIFLLFSNLF
ncbi:hypothetical protein XELAEV_18014158mg [Xenopus laevis]|uniref:Uncharacterized protein n=1 Tax=Xenopus laevis TaxID=8355 RepID=A0A974DGB5_XENLA|nr:hypothetical protein XELAEV_18014158mg [Xenopus laevis]